MVIRLLEHSFESGDPTVRVMKEVIRMISVMKNPVDDCGKLIEKGKEWSKDHAS